MIVQSGKYAGQTAELILLKAPDWAEWLMHNHPKNPLVQEFQRLIGIFDAKPFTKPCYHCQKQATRASAYRGTGEGLYFWCDSCDPHWAGAFGGKLTLVRTFRGALSHVSSTCSAGRVEKRIIIKELAQGKGLPKRVGVPQAAAFFAQTE